mgnify:FL=1
MQLPRVLPPVVPGYALLLLLGTRGSIGHWLDATFGIVLAFTWKGAVVASAVMAFRLLVQPVRVAYRLIDTRLEQAATTLGATMAFVGNIPGETRTLPLAIYSFRQLPDGEAAAMRLAIFSIAPAVSHWTTRRAERRLGYLDHQVPRA